MISEATYFEVMLSKMCRAVSVSVRLKLWVVETGMVIRCCTWRFGIESLKMILGQYQNEMQCLQAISAMRLIKWCCAVLPFQVTSIWSKRLWLSIQNRRSALKPWARKTSCIVGPCFTSCDNARCETCCQVGKHTSESILELLPKSDRVASVKCVLNQALWMVDTEPVRYLLSLWSRNCGFSCIHWTTLNWRSLFSV